LEIDVDAAENEARSHYKNTEIPKL
jgi:hypothetical protein